MKLATIKNIHRELNNDLFNNALSIPRIHAMRNRWIYAYCADDNGESAMGFNLRLIPRGWLCVYALVYHEMCHQYELEILGGSDTWEHGKNFRRVYRDFNKRNFPLYFERV